MNAPHNSDPSDSTIMRAVEASRPPTPWERAGGILLIGLSGWLAYLELPAWLVAGAALYGVWLVAPVRARELTREIRRGVPWLPSPPPKDE